MMHDTNGIEARPFRLRVLHGPNAGKYLKRADYRGMETTTDPAEASKYSPRDAYGNIAAAIDMLCVCLAPESDGTATRVDEKQFGEIAARDMLQNAGPEMVDMFVNWSCRRSADESLEQPPNTTPNKGGYLSVWEWMSRAWFTSMKNRPIPEKEN